MASVTFERVTKRFDTGLIAVNSLDLFVEDGEFMVLVGPSGSGKTTALRMLAGLEEVTEGTIRIGPRVVTHLPPPWRDIAMVFQSYALYPHMTVYDNLKFSLRLRRVPRKETDVKVREAAADLQLAELLDRKPRQLSGGQRQRVALGRAMVRNPQAFLLDEPLSNLDAQLRSETRVHLKRLHQRLGATFIYVTHDQIEAMTLGDRIAVMDGGILQQVGNPRDLYETPANLFVASFIGSPKMNLIPARIEADRAVTSGFAVPLRQRCPVSKVLLGVRAEDFSEGVSAGSADASITFQVDTVELLGSDQLVYGKCGGDELVARVGRNTPVAAGSALNLGVSSAHLHVFDSDTGARV